MDLPGDSLLKTLHRSPYKGYDSDILMDMLDKRLKKEFPEAINIKVNVIGPNVFFGIHVIGEDIDQVLAVQKRVSDVIKGAVERSKIL